MRFIRDHRSYFDFLCGLCVFARNNFTQSRKVLIIVSLIFLAVTHTFAQSNLDDLRNKISTGSVEDKRNALLTIRNLHTEEASRIAVAALSDPDELVRSAAATAVVSLPGRDAAALVIPLLNDKDELVRVEAAYGLGEIVDAVRSKGGLFDLAINQAVVPALIQKLKHDKVGRIRIAAAVALGHFTDPSAVGALTAILKSKPREEDEFLRRSAARSIGQSVQINRTGKPEVSTPQNFLPDKYKFDYPLPESTIGNFNPETVTTLLHVLQNPKEGEDTRREAAFALGNMSEFSAIPVLRSYQTSPDLYLAEICKEALIKIEGRQ